MRDRPLSNIVPAGGSLLRLALTLLALYMFAPLRAQAIVVLTGTTYSENFNSLPAVNTTWVNDSVVNGWHFFRQPGIPLPDGQILRADQPTPDWSGIFNIGSGTDRALGFSGAKATLWNSAEPGTIGGWLAVAIRNETGNPITSAKLEYTGEQWARTRAVDTITVKWGTGASFAEVTNWTELGSSFTFTTPRTGAEGNIDGNGTGNFANISGNVSLNWAVGETIWFAFTEFNVVDIDPRLAVDNFKITVIPVPEPGTAALLVLAAGLLSCRRARLR